MGVVGVVGVVGLGAAVRTAARQEGLTTMPRAMEEVRMVRLLNRPVWEERGLGRGLGTLAQEHRKQGLSWVPFSVCWRSWP